MWSYKYKVSLQQTLLYIPLYTLPTCSIANIEQRHHKEYNAVRVFPVTIIYYHSSCMPQKPTVCSTLGGRASDYISPSNLPYDVTLDQTHLAFGKISLEFILNFTQSPSACFEGALHQMCLVVEPPCDPDTYAPLLLCPETCHAYNKLFSSGVCDSFSAEITRQLESGRTLPEFMAIKNYSTLFNCSDPLTYFQNGSVEVCDNSSIISCTNLFSPATQSKS